MLGRSDNLTAETSKVQWAMQLEMPNSIMSSRFEKQWRTWRGAAEVQSHGTPTLLCASSMTRTPNLFLSISWSIHDSQDGNLTDSEK